VALQRLAHELQCRGLVASPRHEALEHLAFVIDGSPQVAHLAVHLHVHLIKVPLPLTEAAHAADPLATDVTGKQRTEPVPPVANRLMADVDAAVREQVFNVPQRQRVFDVQHHRQPDHLGRAVEVAEGICGAAIGHAGLANPLPLPSA
jgi:hypothetical protein